uniref:Uncharacterized protein MANES_15G048200 n=1 Tax=Rhizophora mucronata TaxID=61149 RepID=A0A2P2MC75_RHIMU
MDSMASAQVLPNSRKQEHLEAGKRRLEEFRKKKAAERAKKASASIQPHASDARQDLTQPLETERVQCIDSDEADTSDRPNGTTDTFSVSIDNKDNIMDVIKKAEQGSLKDHDDNPPSFSNYNRTSADVIYKQTNNQDLKRHDASKLLGAGAVNYGRQTNEIENNSLIYTGSQGGLPYQSLANHSVASHPQDSAGLSLASHVTTSPSNSATLQMQTEPGNVSFLSPDEANDHHLL